MVEDCCSSGTIHISVVPAIYELLQNEKCRSLLHCRSLWMGQSGRQFGNHYHGKFFNSTLSNTTGRHETGLADRIGSARNIWICDRGSLSTDKSLQPWDAHCDCLVIAHGAHCHSDTDDNSWESKDMICDDLEHPTPKKSGDQ